MRNTNNTYFENLKKIGHDWEAARSERRARKQQIIETYGWGSEELKAWGLQSLPSLGTEHFPQGG